MEEKDIWLIKHGILVWILEQQVWVGLPLILNIKLLEKIKKDYGELDYLKKLRLQKNAEDIVLVEED